MLIENPWARLREWTGARIALGRAGHSLPTRELLAFQLAHARARDAVDRTLDAYSLASALPGESIILKSQAQDRAAYLRRPDLGRRLDAESANRVSRGEWDAAIIVADGLSALAAHRHAEPLIRALTAQLDGWKIGPIFIVEQGRVAIGDEIGGLAEASLAVILIGERPGLSSPDSLGVYLTWSPRIGRTDAERNCVSNIRTEGLDPALAAVRVAGLMRAAREKRVTGVQMTKLIG
jgi:ethanolamine ammonia-lyase small subunit